MWNGPDAGRPKHSTVALPQPTPPVAHSTLLFQQSMRGVRVRAYTRSSSEWFSGPTAPWQRAWPCVRAAASHGWMD